MEILFCEIYTDSHEAENNINEDPQNTKFPPQDNGAENDLTDGSEVLKVTVFLQLLSNPISE